MSITIQKFAELYYGVEIDENVKITHKIFSKLFPSVRRCTFEYANKNPGLISAGKIVYVTDYYNQLCPYKVPKNVRKHGIQPPPDGYRCTVTNSDMHSNNHLRVDLANLESVPTYKLGQLLSEYKNSPAMYRCIRKKLENRGVYSNKLYRVKSIVVELEEEPDLPDGCDYSLCIDRCKRRVRRAKSSAQIKKKGRW